MAYLAKGFHGSQRQPGLRTVEGDLIEGLMKSGVITDAHRARFQCASRTDRGVQALGNVFAVSTASHPLDVIAGQNAVHGEIWLYAYAPVPEGFNARWASDRWYRYHLPNTLPANRLRRGTELLLSMGDLRAFQNQESVSPPRLTSVAVAHHGDRIALDLRAIHFVRNMVRRIATGLQLFAEGSISRAELKGALLGQGRRLAPAPPEHLVLMDVDYGFAFLPFKDGRLRDDVVEAWEGLAIETSLLSQLRERLGDGMPEWTSL